VDRPQTWELHLPEPPPALFLFVRGTDNGIYITVRTRR